MKTIRFSPAAQADMGATWDHSADRWGLDQADNYIDAIRDACQALARGTKQGRSAEVLPGFHKYLCGSHVVYFLDSSDHVDVIRVLHQRQDAELHL